MPRLDVLLARNLGLSRRQVTQALRSGRVRDESGSPLQDPKVPIPPTSLPRTIRLDEEVHELHHRYGLLQHKPVGVVTALRDARHPCAFDLLGPVPLRRELRAVGRLDKDTSGLLLWTTDGALLHRMTHPRYSVPRTYHAALARPWRAPPDDLVLEDGHRPEIADLHPLEPSALHPALLRPADATCFAAIVLTSGRFHEVRRIFAALGSHVVALCRVRYGPVSLPLELPPGEALPLDVHALFSGMHPRPKPERDPGSA